jgi:hypothetical protein
MQVAHVAQYFARTFFRHFRLYSFLFSTPQDLAESSASLLVSGWFCKLYLFSVSRINNSFVCMVLCSAYSSCQQQVETAIVPSFECALVESEWMQALEDKQVAEEAAAQGELV